METAGGGGVVYSVMYAVLFSKYVVMHGCNASRVLSEHAQFWGVASCCAPCWLISC